LRARPATLFRRSARPHASPCSPPLLPYTPLFRSDLPGCDDRLAEFGRAPRAEEEVRGPTDLERRIRRERDVTLDPVRAEPIHQRSEEHTSELQSREKLVFRLLLEKKTISLLLPTT